MNLFRLIVLLLFFIASQVIHAQNDNVRIGSVERKIPVQGAVFDYSDPNSVNMHVSIWGYSRIPGHYIVPVHITLADLISYSGGPTADALIEDVRVIRTFSDSTQQVFNFNYNELMYEPKIKGRVKNMTLEPGDMVVLPGEPRFYFRDYFSMTLSIVSTLISVSILVLSIVRK